MRITIVGAGFSGSTLATLLASTRDDAPDVCLVGVEESFARGVAYGEARPEHLLNVRARNMGADPDEPEEFAEWLNLGPRARDAFLPRLAYGEYLADRLRISRSMASNLTCIEHEAIAVDRTRSGFRVHLANGEHFASDRVVLALGALPPQRLGGVGPRLARDPRYVGWPWQDDALARIAPDARVLIAGTGLTMADVVASLHRRGHRGDIVALSRHGRLPGRHLHEPGTPLELPPTVRLALRAHDLHSLLAALRPLMRIAPDWRCVIDALRPHAQAFWQGLPAGQCERFLRHLRAHWDSVRHRLAPQLAAELDLLQVSGQLQVRAGRLLRAGLRADAIEVLIRDRGQQDARVERFDYLVRATGLDTDIVRTTHPLMLQLREAGLVRADPLGLGLEATPGFDVIDSNGQPVPGLYCLGPLLRGQLWEITAVPELRNAAKALAARLQRRAATAEAVASVAGEPGWRYG